MSTLGISCNGGCGHLPPGFVYPLLGLLIGGFILWGELSGSKNVPVEDDTEGVFFFWFLLVSISVLFYMMFVRLDKLSHKEERHRYFNSIPDSSPSHAKRHRFCVSAPWDSYQWAAGALLIAISEIFLGVCFPAFSGPELYFAYIWVFLFAVTWISLLVFMCIDPSQGVTAEEKKRICETPAVGDVGGPGSLVLYCKLSGCRRHYAGKYRKHCKCCNKCVEGFDHHCPFLNQCIGTNNYNWFMAILTSYIGLMLFTIAAGLMIIVELCIEDSSLSKHAHHVWGRYLFGLFAAMLVLLPLPKLYFMVPLWLFHVKLCGLSWASGGEHYGTYMFTRDPATAELRGRAAYMDERARHLLVRVVHFNFMNVPSAFAIWQQEHHLTKEVRNCRRAVMDGWWAILNGSVEKTSGVNITGKTVQALTDGSEKYAGGVEQKEGLEKTMPSEHDPLLKSIAVDKDMADERDLPLHSRPAKKSCLPVCIPGKKGDPNK
jgi:hypothetical protein